ncbi:faciogenital dysplasia protein [Anaeramoeba flamelloides]|uniref:Faciogenital dysplasia protein n=1 Tax=Anaeramoeba flamelloides TaxID=1746091 RepID=A0AAV7Y1Q5_9EUKA|nr:faciogenital dysplasia protein [Anaeramoeba flamelloides]
MSEEPENKKDYKIVIKDGKIKKYRRRKKTNSEETIIIIDKNGNKKRVRKKKKTTPKTNNQNPKEEKEKESQIKIQTLDSKNEGKSGKEKEITTEKEKEKEDPENKKDYKIVIKDGKIKKYRRRKKTNSKETIIIIDKNGNKKRVHKKQKTSPKTNNHNPKEEKEKTITISTTNSNELKKKKKPTIEKLSRKLSESQELTTLEMKEQAEFSTKIESTFELAIKNTMTNEKKAKVELSKEIDPNTSMRDNVVQEILSSERLYVSNLEILMDKWKVELVERAKSPKEMVIPQEIIDKIFGNLNEIYQINKIFLNKLEKKILNWNEQSTIGDFFLELIPFFKLYTTYFRSYSKSNEIVLQYLKNSSFKNWVDQKKKETNNLGLQSFLILPIQRLPRYELFLKSLRKNCPWNHPDFTNLQTAWEAIIKVNQHINEEIKNTENQQKMLQIQRRFNSNRLKDLIAPHRYYICTGPLTKVSSNKFLKRQFFLFSDLLLYGTANAGFYQLHRRTNLLHMKIQNIPDTEKLQNAFIMHGKQKSFTVFAATPQEKDNWLKHLQNAIQECRRKNQTLKTSNVMDDHSQDLAPVLDSNNKKNNCSICFKKFTTFRRKHNCNKCGNLVCGACSNKKLLLKYISESNLLRVCDNCYFDYFQEQQKRNRNRNKIKNDNENGNENEYRAQYDGFEIINDENPNKISSFSKNYPKKLKHYTLNKLTINKNKNKNKMRSRSESNINHLMDNKTIDGFVFLESEGNKTVDLLQTDVSNQNFDDDENNQKHIEKTQSVTEEEKNGKGKGKESENEKVNGNINENLNDELQDQENETMKKIREQITKITSEFIQSSENQIITKKRKRKKRKRSRKRVDLQLLF